MHRQYNQNCKNINRLRIVSDNHESFNIEEYFTKSIMTFRCVPSYDASAQWVSFCIPIFSHIPRCFILYFINVMCVCELLVCIFDKLGFGHLTVTIWCLVWIFIMMMMVKMVTTQYTQDVGNWKSGILNCMMMGGAMLKLSILQWARIAAVMIAFGKAAYKTYYLTIIYKSK